MRILMVIGQFAPIVGGAERQCALLARALTARGHAVRVLTVRPERGVPLRTAHDGVPIDRVAYPILRVAGHRMGLGFLAFPLLAWRTYRLLKTHDIVIAHQALWPACAAAIAARLRHRPLMVKLGNSGTRFDLDVLVRTHWYGRVARRFLERHAARWVATSAAVRADLRHAGISDARIATIPNGVVLPPPRETQQASDHLRCVFVGTLTPKKNVAAFLDALVLLPTDVRSRVTVTIAGDGPLRSTLDARARSNGVADQVSFVGTVADVPSLLAQHDVFVLPSQTEGLANAALEAAAAGLPLLLTDVGGNPDLVPAAVQRDGESGKRGTTGMLMPSGDHAALARALAWYLEHPDERRRMGCAARTLVERCYEITSVAAQYDDLCRVLTRPRIVHLITFLDSQTGGMERQALQLARILRERGYTSLFITCFHGDRMRREGLRVHGLLEGFPVYRIPFLRGWRRMNAVVYLLCGVILLRVFRRRYDIIHAHQLHTSGIVAAAALWFLPHTPLIVKDCAVGAIGDVANLGRFPMRGGVRLLRAAVDACVGVSTSAADEMRMVGLPHIHVIPNGVDTSYLRPPTHAERFAARAAYGIGDTATIVFVGRLGPEKKVEILLDAFAALPLVAMLLVTGDGELRADLERHAAKQGIATHTRFLGVVRNIRTLYHAADVLALPSLSEGMPNVILEAMACGLPVVASDLPVTRDMLGYHGGAGLLVPVGDSVAFAAALQAILTSHDHGVVFGHEGRKRVQDRFDIVMVAQRYVAVYDNLIASL